MANLTAINAVRDGSAEVTFENAASSQTMVYNKADERIILIAKNSHETNSSTITVKAGTGLRKSIGDLAVTVDAGDTVVIGPLDSMRFKTLSTGTVTVTVSGGTVTLAQINI